ncbi:MAG: HD domain-containing protein [Bacteroidales bacterium]|nr:HD domain-containing protein [Bacteroidales bacterium]
MQRRSYPKIVNDPVYGFIRLPDGIGFRILEHRWFQRLRNIKQLGLAYLVYPGAVHTRFQHSLGAYHLSIQALEVLKNKGINISKDEEVAVSLALLLHDIGHSPFSHLLEGIILKDISHEKVTIAYIHHLNKLYDNALSLTLEIYMKKYSKKFLSQLISGELDMDRLDYLKRDSFYTGVMEGVISTDRIIKMLCVYDNKLAVEEKGIYSVEKFLIARRLMYWQVYLHKTVLAADTMLTLIFKRVYYLYQNGLIVVPDILKTFWKNKIKFEDILKNMELIEEFSLIDDNEVWHWIRKWSYHPDFILSFLCNNLLRRNLFKIYMSNLPFSKEKIEKIKELIKKKFNLNDNDVNYLIVSNKAVNRTYCPTDFNINILTKNNDLKDISKASDIFNMRILSKRITKYFLCFVREINYELS